MAIWMLLLTFSNNSYLPEMQIAWHSLAYNSPRLPENKNQKKGDYSARPGRTRSYNSCYLFHPKVYLVSSLWVWIHLPGLPGWECHLSDICHSGFRDPEMGLVTSHLSSTGNQSHLCKIHIWPRHSSLKSANIYQSPRAVLSKLIS